MSRKPKNAPVLPWTTSKEDLRKVKSWTAFDSDLLSHPAFVALNRTAALTYIMLSIEAHGQREFTCPYSVAARCGISRNSYTVALKELTEKGFIHYSSGKATRQENTITFVYDWKGQTPTRKRQRRKPIEQSED